MSGIATAVGGVGITLGYRTGGTGAYTTIAQLRDDCEFDGFDTAIILTPVLGSPAVTKVPGRTDYGTFTGSVWAVNVDAGVAELVTLHGSKATLSWQVMLPDGSSATTGSTYSFSGFVSNIKPGNFTGEDASTMDFTIAVTGPVVMAPAT